jgi:hypothetical protein
MDSLISIGQVHTPNENHVTYNYSILTAASIGLYEAAPHIQLARFAFVIVRCMQAR